VSISTDKNPDNQKERLAVLGLADLQKEQEWTEQLLFALRAGGFYGVLELKFEGGRVVHAVKKQSLSVPTKDKM